MSEHGFCRTLLSITRQDAARYAVKIPAHLTAMGHGREYYIEAPGIDGEYHKGCCAWAAKAHYIARLIERQHPDIIGIADDTV